MRYLSMGDTHGIRGKIFVVIDYIKTLDKTDADGMAKKKHVTVPMTSLLTDGFRIEEDR